MNLSWFRLHHLQPHSTDLLTIHGAQRLLGCLPIAEERVATPLPVQEIEINETSEPAEHILDHVDGGLGRAAHQEQSLHHRAVGVGERLGRRQRDAAVRRVVDVGGRRRGRGRPKRIPRRQDGRRRPI